MDDFGRGNSRQGPSNDLLAQYDQKFIEIEEKLSEKANKSSVAQALHRKANKPEVDASIATRAEVTDL